jgi:hypothetical protein
MHDVWRYSRRRAPRTGTDRHTPSQLQGKTAPNFVLFSFPFSLLFFFFDFLSFILSLPAVSFCDVLKRLCTRRKRFAGGYDPA